LRLQGSTPSLKRTLLRCVDHRPTRWPTGEPQQLLFHRREPLAEFIQRLPTGPALLHQGGNVRFRPTRQIQGSRSLRPVHPPLPAADVLRQPQQTLALQLGFRFQGQPIAPQLLLPFAGLLLRQQGFLLGIGPQEALQGLLQSGLQLIEPVS